MRQSRTSEGVELTPSIIYSQLLKRRIRAGDYREQTRSTWAAIAEAVERRDAANAARLAAYAVDESKFNADCMTQWRADLRALLLKKGVTVEEIASTEQGLLALLTLPDGTPFDLPRQWNAFLDLVQSVQAAAYEQRWNDALALLDQTREAWRIISDRDVDWCSGMLNDAVVRFGEQVVPEIWDAILWPLFNSRYERFDIDKADWAKQGLPTLLYVALECMRNYLSTPQRDGAPLELIEHEDRWVLRFDPCGSGGRSMRGEPLEGAPSRMEAPFNFRVIEGAYDWTDGKKGICVYCNHCQVLMEHWPMDRFGYPIRVIEPPTYPASDPISGRATKCQWTMYKDPTKAPVEVYERAGRKKPNEFGARAHRNSAREVSTTSILSGA